MDAHEATAHPTAHGTINFALKFDIDNEVISFSMKKLIYCNQN